MRTKQIVILGLIATAALLFALFWQPRSAALPINDTSTLSVASSTGEAVSHEARSETRPLPAPSKLATAPTAASKTNTQQLPVVHMKIIEPDGVSTFDVDLHEGDDLCETTEQAKAQGHIHSLTIDDSYLATFGSRYVREINGYSNNWTVEVNGVGPKGCSLYDPEAGDTIVWTFGVAKD